MRLREIQKKIAELEPTRLALTYSWRNQEELLLTDLIDYRLAVLQIAEIDALSPVITPILKSSIFGHDRDAFSVNHGPVLVEKADLLFNTVKGLKLILDSLQVEEDPNSVSIRLPDEESMATLVDDLKTIEMAISQLVVNPQLNGEVKVKTWSPGSLWLEITVGSTVALLAVGRVVWAALFLHKKKLENDFLRQHVRALEIDNDSRENLEKAQSKLLDNMLLTEARAVEAEFFGDEDPERLARIKFSIERFSDLIGRGAEVLPALNAPPEEKAEFPDFGHGKFIESRVKLIDAPQEEGGPEA